MPYMSRLFRIALKSPARCMAGKGLMCMMPVALMLSGAACRRASAPDYVEYHAPSAGHWDTLDELVYHPHIPGQKETTPESYDLVITVRHSGRVSGRSLDLVLAASSGGQEIMRDTMAVRLADDNGRMLGKTSYSVYTVSQTLLPGIRVPRSYEISLRPARAAGIDGVNNIGLSLIKRD